MNMMDWGDIGDFVSFGEVGRDQIDDASYYILIAPQNVVGSTILTNLGDMVCSLQPVIIPVLLRATGILAIGHVEQSFYLHVSMLSVSSDCSSLPCMQEQAVVVAATGCKRQTLLSADADILTEQSG